MINTIANTLEEFLHNEDPTIAEAASILLQLKNQWENGMLSEAEYNELVQNTIDNQYVTALTQGLHTQNVINAIFSRLVMLAKIVL